MTGVDPAARDDGYVPLSLYSRALDEIYQLRSLLAHEAAIREADLGYATYPKGRREAAVRAIRRMRDTARGEGSWLSDIEPRALRAACDAAGMPSADTTPAPDVEPIGFVQALAVAVDRLLLHGDPVQTRAAQVLLSYRNGVVRDYLADTTPAPPVTDEQAREQAAAAMQRVAEVCYGHDDGDDAEWERLADRAEGEVSR